MRQRLVEFGLGGALLSGLLLAIFPGPWLAHSTDIRLVHHLLTEVAHGHLNGSHTTSVTAIDESIMEPGDILVCHNPHGGYGYWTHAVLYIGNGTVVDSNDFVQGTVKKPLSHYRAYEQVAILRVRAEANLRRSVAVQAQAEVGKPYDPFSSLEDGHSEYCSKLIWEVFRTEGVQLLPRHHWVTPDNLVHSSKVQMICQWGQVTQE